MNRPLLFLAVLTMLCSVPKIGFAEEKKPTCTKLRILLPAPKERPRAPQRHSSVECYYENGMISIQFETPEGDATFTVTDVMTGDNASTTFNTAVEFSYFIGTEPSTYLLEISTSAGNAYEGYLTLE